MGTSGEVVANCSDPPGLMILENTGSSLPYAKTKAPLIISKEIAEGTELAEKSRVEDKR